MAKHRLGFSASVSVGEKGVGNLVKYERDCGVKRHSLSRRVDILEQPRAMIRST